MLPAWPRRRDGPTIYSRCIAKSQETAARIPTPTLRFIRTADETHRWARRLSMQRDYLHLRREKLIAGHLTRTCFRSLAGHFDQLDTSRRFTNRDTSGQLLTQPVSRQLITSRCSPTPWKLVRQSVQAPNLCSSCRAPPTASMSNSIFEVAGSICRRSTPQDAGPATTPDAAVHGRPSTSVAYVSE